MPLSFARSLLAMAAAVSLLSTHTQAASIPVQARAAGSKTHLTILPMGASITVGVDSSDGNGYRQRLEQLLHGHGASVSYVGTVHSGSMSDNAVQAVAGQTISQIATYADSTNVWQFQPDVVLLNAGTNNCNTKYGNHVAAPQDYSALLAKLRSHWPNALIVASSLVRNLDPTVNTCVSDLSARLHDVTIASNHTGKLAWADMYNAVPASDITVRDRTHPTDAGYQIMAQTWLAAILAASPRMWPAMAATPKAKAVVPGTSTTALPESSAVPPTAAVALPMMTPSSSGLLSQGTETSSATGAPSSTSTSTDGRSLTSSSITGRATPSASSLADHASAGVNIPVPVLILAVISVVYFAIWLLSLV